MGDRTSASAATREGRRGGRRLVAAVAVAVAVAVVAAACSSGPDTARVDGEGRRRPNVLVVMTDDQTLESLRVMPNVNRQLAGEGTTFASYYVSFANCCPSRATYLTGQYSHNNGVEDNLPPLGGVGKLRDDETLPVWLQRAGYWTASVGKYLNGWGADGDISPPPGWNRWFGLIDPTTYQYYDYAVSVDGERRQYGRAAEDYQTDVLGAEVVSSIRARAGQDQPWFLSFTPLAPHAEKPETSSTDQAESDDGQFRWAFPKPAPRHERSLVAKAPRGPAFDAANTGKPPALAARPPLSDGLVKLVDQGYQLELETLQAVDDWVGRIVDALRETGQLDDTVVLFTSDNGFFHGEHRLSFVKYFPYEPAVHVPLIIRGGPFGKAKRVEQVAVNADLAPTILALAGATPGLEPDGRDLAPLAADPKVGADRGVLLENKSKGGQNHSEAIHTGRYVYIETDGGAFEELYDLDKDPAQLTNLAGDPAVASLQAELARRLEALRTCRGASCNVGTGR